MRSKDFLFFRHLPFSLLALITAMYLGKSETIEDLSCFQLFKYIMGEPTDTDRLPLALLPFSIGELLEFLILG